jgi:hypothetical protein
MNLLKGMIAAALLCIFWATVFLGPSTEVMLLGAAVGVGIVLWWWVYEHKGGPVPPP